MRVALDIHAEEREVSGQSNKRIRLARCHSAHQAMAQPADNRIPPLDRPPRWCWELRRSFTSGGGIQCAQKDGHQKTTMKTPTKGLSAEVHTAKVVSTSKSKRSNPLRRWLAQALTRRQTGVDYEQMRPEEKKLAVADLQALACQIQNEPDFLLTTPMIRN